MAEQRRERRTTLQSRCEEVAELISDESGPAVIWCNLNDEGDLLEKLIPGAVQVAGKHSDREKEDRLVAFSEGRIDKLITKPKIGGWGLNWQHCNRMTYFPTNSWESWYQAVRRCWRFGQKRKVVVDVVASSGESRILLNLQRKERQATNLFSEIVRSLIVETKNRENGGVTKVEVPEWLHRS